jgi:hypothetical protein
VQFSPVPPWVKVFFLSLNFVLRHLDGWLVGLFRFIGGVGLSP